jgi:hypothetical protein
MLRRRTIRAAAFALLLAGTAPSLALAMELGSPRPAAAPQSLLDQMWSTVRSLFPSFGLSSDSGQGMDPNGRQPAAPDAGQEMDPDG